MTNAQIIGGSKKEDMGKQKQEILFWFLYDFYCFWPSRDNTHHGPDIKVCYT